MDSGQLSTRREMLVAGVAAASTLLVGGVVAGQTGVCATVPAFAAQTPAQTPAQYGFYVRTGNCIDCGKCVEACRLWNRTPENGPARRKVSAYTDSVGRTRYVTTSCMHCEDPACLRVCPAGAISKGEGGIVTVDKDRCIGCKYCAQACPFDAPHYYADGMDKCDYCLGNGVPLGEKPHCVKACPNKALGYGTLEELAAAGNGKAKRLEGSTLPALYLV